MAAFLCLQMPGQHKVGASDWTARGVTVYCGLNGPIYGSYHSMANVVAGSAVVASQKLWSRGWRVRRISAWSFSQEKEAFIVDVICLARVHIFSGRRVSLLFSFTVPLIPCKHRFLRAVHVLARPKLANLVSIRPLAVLCEWRWCGALALPTCTTNENNDKNQVRM